MSQATVAAPAAAPRTEEKLGYLDQILEATEMHRQLTPLLPGINESARDEEYERVAATVRLYARANPKILQCTRESIELAIMKVAQWGLSIGDTAHLVPFNVNVAGKNQRPIYESRLTPIADYKGLIQLMIETKVVRFVEAHCVYEKDEFDCVLGSDRHLHHRPWAVPGDRGKLRGAWVMFHLPFNVPVWDYMRLDEIDEIRMQYSKQWGKTWTESEKKAGRSGACPGWYAKKCIIRQGSKLVPKDRRIAKAMSTIRDEERTEYGEELDKIVERTQRMREDEELSDTLNKRLDANVAGTVLEGAEEEDDAELAQRLGGAGVAAEDPEPELDPLDVKRAELARLATNELLSQRSRDLLAQAAEDGDLTLERAADMVDETSRWLRKRQLNLPNEMPMPKGAPSATQPSQAKLIEDVREYPKRYPHMADTVGQWELETMSIDRLKECLSILKDAAAVYDRGAKRGQRRDDA